MRRSSCSMKPPRHSIRNPKSRYRRRSNISARTAPPSSSPIACTLSCTPTPFWWSSAARSSSAAGMTIYCAAVGATPRSSACSIGMQGLSLWRRSAQRLKATIKFPSPPPRRDPLMSATSFVIPALPQPCIPVAGDTKSFPVRRIWCVGRNYLEHIREMGNDERAPPFFFAKHADMLVPEGATIPYPPLTKDLHHEVELIVAMKSGGLRIPADKALEHVYGYAVGIDLTRRDLQIASRKKERPWEVGKSFDYSAPCSAVQPASKIGHPSKGKIWLTVNGTEQQKGDLTELIWSVPEIIWQLSQQVALAAGDIIMTGTPAGVSALSPGDKIECGVDGVGTLKVAIGEPE